MDRLDRNNSELTAPTCPIASAALVYVDLETTGLHPERGAEVTEAALLDDGGLRLHWRADSGSADFDTVLPAIAEHLHTGVVVGHNLSFDFQFLAYEAARRDRRGFQVRYLDTLALAKRLAPDLPDHRLESLVDRWDLPLEGTMHQARVDVRATRKLLWHLVDTADLHTLADAGLSRLDWTAV